MGASLQRARLLLFLMKHHGHALWKGERTIEQIVRSLRKQKIVTSLLREAKYSPVGKKVFIDPFAPYFPSPYSVKMFNNNSSDSFPPKPNFAQISITNKCPCKCVHCHVKNTQDDDMPKEVILKAIEDISKADCPLIFFVGGEPLSRFQDLLEFVELSKKTMDTRIFTSGVGATPEKLAQLKEAGLEGICVSLDHYEEEIHNTKRNNRNAYRAACEAIELGASLGFYISVVCCTTRTMVHNGELFGVVDFAESLGAHSIQLNEIRPVGRALESEGYDFFLAEEDKRILIDYYRKSNESSRRIAIVMPWYNEEPYKFGCTATSGQQAYIDAKGNVQPCPLLKAGLGNINSESFSDVWARFREQCGHPVRECIVHRLAGEMERSKTLPLPPGKTYELWPEICKIEATDAFKKIAALGYGGGGRSADS